MPTKQRPPASSVVAKTAIEQANMTLQDLPERPKEAWSLRESIALLLDPITIALDRGYSYEEISSILSSAGVSITASSLKRYLATARRQADGGARPRRMRKARTDEKAEPAAEAPAAEAAPAPAKRARSTTGRKTAAKAAPAKAAAKTRQSPKSTTAAKPAPKATRRRKASS